MFQKMDIERRRQDAALGAERKPRLIEECELPEFLLKDLDDEEEEEEKKALELGRGNRSRKETNYDDQLSEKEWLKAIGAEDEEFEDEDEVDDGAKKKSGKKQKRREEEEEDEPKKKKKKSAFKKLQKQMRKLLEIVIQYEDQDGRVLSDPFMKLPTRKELPDYYEVIRKPVDITKILTKIEDGKYEDMDVMEKDFMLLCINTQKYNEDGSLIHEDSIVLQSVFTNAREKLSLEWDDKDDDPDLDEGSSHAPSEAAKEDSSVNVSKEEGEISRMEDDSEDVSLASTASRSGTHRPRKNVKKKDKEDKPSKGRGRKKKKKTYEESDDEDDEDY